MNALRKSLINRAVVADITQPLRLEDLIYISDSTSDSDTDTDTDTDTETDHDSALGSDMDIFMGWNAAGTSSDTATAEGCWNSYWDSDSSSSSSSSSSSDDGGRADSDALGSIESLVFRFPLPPSSTDNTPPPPRTPNNTPRSEYYDCDCDCGFDNIENGDENNGSGDVGAPFHGLWEMNPNLIPVASLPGIFADVSESGGVAAPAPPPPYSDAGEFLGGMNAGLTHLGLGHCLYAVETMLGFNGSSPAGEAGVGVAELMPTVIRLVTIVCATCWVVLEKL